MNELILILHDIGCRNDCVFCGKVEYCTKEIANQTAEEELRKLEVFKEDKKIDSIIISGNDPIEYHDFVGFLRKIKEVTDTNITLNSHCINFEDISFLRKVLDCGNIKSIQIPVYGHTPGIHDSVTQNRGSFDSVLRTFDNLKTLNFSNIIFNSLILRQNEDCIVELLSFLLKFQKRINISLPCIPSSNGQYAEKHLKNIPDLDKTLSSFKIIREKFKDHLDKIFIYDMPHCLAPLRIENLGFRSKSAFKGYDHFRNTNTDTMTVENEVIASYRCLVKPKICERCSYDSVCLGITKPYVDLGLFKAKPFIERHH